MTTSSSAAPAWGFGLRLLGLIAVMAGGAFLVARLQLGWVGTLVVMLLAGGGGTVLLARFVARHGERAGALTPALRRYNKRMIASTFVYLFALFAAVYAYKELRPEGAGAWLIALLPSLGVMGMIWSMARLLQEEADEYIRLKLVQQSLFAAGVLLVVATLWGFFEQFALVPHVPSWAALPVFAVGIGLSSLMKWVRA